MAQKNILISLEETLEANPSSDIPITTAKFLLGAQVRHRVFPFRGIIFDVDPCFNNTEEWYQSIPTEMRPRKDQPFYHLLAENADHQTYIAYVSEQNLLLDDNNTPVRHEAINAFFTGTPETGLQPKQVMH